MAQFSTTVSSFTGIPKKPQHVFFSRVRPDHPRYRSATWICMCRHSHDPVIYSKFHRNPFRGFGAPSGGQNLAFPITLATRFYNSLYYCTSRDKPWLFAFNLLPRQQKVFIGVSFFSEHERTWTNVHVRYMPSPVHLSSDCNVRAQYLAVWNFRQFFYAIWYIGHSLTSTEILRRQTKWDPSVRGLNARGRGSQI